MPAAAAARRPFEESSIAAQSAAGTLEPPRRLQVDVGRRLASLDLLRGDRRREELCETRTREDALDHGPVRRGGDGERKRSSEAAYGVDGAVDQRKLGVVAFEQSPDDLVVDLLRRLREPELVVHVARPFGRAHPHHVRLGAVVPPPAALAHEPLAHVVPDLLRVDDDAVEIEDDGPDHGAA